jgi:hypothetical protein
MTLSINATTTIADVQAAFSQEFPSLKVEFFTRPHDVGESTWSKYMVFNKQERFGKLAAFKGNDVPFELNGAMTVAAFEQNFQKYFGLGVQVFRKSMGTWLITSTTDNWTLAAQNAQGQESATTLNEMIYIERTSDSAVN